MPYLRGTMDKDALFDTADLYTHDDAPEDISCEDAEEAVWMFLDQCDPEPETVTIYAYKRDALPANTAEWHAERLVERFQEDLSEEYGGLDGDPIIPEVAEEKLKLVIEAALGFALTKAVVWRCSCVAQRVFNIAEFRKKYDRPVEDAT